MRVIDGDTIAAEARLWPGHTLAVSVRLRGIDAPELRGKCAAERRAAIRARAALTALIGHGSVSLSNIAGGKYYGRVLADVVASDGRALAPLLLDRALVRPYRGRRRESWC